LNQPPEEALKRVISAGLVKELPKPEAGETKAA
jgi:hypothetical protein